MNVQELEGLVDNFAKEKAYLEFGDVIGESSLLRSVLKGTHGRRLRPSRCRTTSFGVGPRSRQRGSVAMPRARASSGARVRD